VELVQTRFGPVVGLRAVGIQCLDQLLATGLQLVRGAVRDPGSQLRLRGRPLLRIESTDSAWTSEFSVGQELVIPVKNGEGRYVADQATLDELTVGGRIVARYLGGNPNGSQRDIAAIRNEAGNVVGIMPHPEHAIDPLTGPGSDGLGFFTSVIRALVTR